MHAYVDPIIDRPTAGRGPSDRQFGFTMSGVFALIALWPLTRHGPVRVWGIGASILLTIVTAAAPAWLRPANKGWTALGRAMQRVTTPVFLALAYYGLVTPTAMLMRLFGVDALRRHADPAAETYWVDRASPGADRASLSRPF